MPGAPLSSPDFEVVVRGPAEVVALQVRARVFAAGAGLANVACWEFAIAVSEAATNMIKYAGGGRVTLRVCEDPRAFVEVIARDHGGGIAGLDQALLDNVSEGSDVRQASDPRRRRGLGLGLGAILRLMDEVEIDSVVGEGTTLRARKFLAPDRSGSGLRAGAG